MDKLRYSTKWWIVVGLLILAIDYYAEEGETLSEAADRALKAHPYLTQFAIWATALHLSNALDSDPRLQRLDVYQLVGLLRRFRPSRARDTAEGLKIALEGSQGARRRGSDAVPGRGRGLVPDAAAGVDPEID